MLGLPPPSPGTAPMTPAAPTAPIMHVGGLVAAVGPQQLAAEEAARAAAAAQPSQVVTGLAGHVRKCYEAAWRARNQDLYERMLKCVRQRRGEYDPEDLAAIRKSGGSAIYMMLSSNKCRAAASWIKDVLMSTREERPWSIEPTAEPQLPPDATEIVAQRAAQEAMALEQQIGAFVVTPDRMREFVERVRHEMLNLAKEEAKEALELMRNKMEDQQQEGGFMSALSEFVDDLVTFPFAVIKGPVPRKRKTLQWVPGPQGTFTPDVKDEIRPEWERVDPFNVFWAPHATEIDDGFFIEKHSLTRSDLKSLEDVDGFDNARIAEVLDDYGRGGLHEWLSMDTQVLTAQGKTSAAYADNPDATIDALQFWGNVSGQMLIDWGMEGTIEPGAEYGAEVWVIGAHVIKAVLNPDPCGHKPYYKTAYEKVPGSWAGNGVNDLIRDCQRMCNAAARALANNMGISSGPQVYVTVDRVPTGEDITDIYPWKIWQVTSDPSGSTAKPVEFFQPGSNAQELFGIYQQFSVLADEYSGVPRYMTGDSPAGGAGRTASGMSMLMSNAGKSVKQVIGNIDKDVTQPLIEAQFYYNMRFADDPELKKGDVKIVARGVNVLVAKEQAQVRMNEILNIVGTNPVFMEIVGEEAIADLLREVTRPLNMDVVPPKEVIRARMLMRQQMMMQQQMLMAQAAQQPENTVEFDRGPDGAVRGARVMPGNKQKLMGGAPVTDNFAPQRRAGGR